MTHTALVATVEKMLDTITKQDIVTADLLAKYQADEEKFVAAIGDGVRALNGIVAEIQESRRRTVMIQAQVSDILQLIQERLEGGDDTGEEWKQA